MDIKLGSNEIACIIDWFEVAHSKGKATLFEEELCDKLEEFRIFLIKNNSMFIHIGSEF